MSCVFCISLMETQPLAEVELEQKEDSVHTDAPSISLSPVGNKEWIICFFKTMLVVWVSSVFISPWIVMPVGDGHMKGFYRGLYVSLIVWIVFTWIFASYIPTSVKALLLISFSLFGVFVEYSFKQLT